MSAENGTASSTPIPPASGRPPRGRYGWLWFFLIVFVLAAAAVATLWVFNVHQQLTPDKLAAARRLWREKGPENYDMTYTESGSVNATYTVRVRGGKVVYAEPDQSHTPEQKQFYYGMPALFNFIDSFLREAAKPGSPRTYLVATFDPHDGHLEHFIRSVTGTGERLEINVDFKAVPPGTPASD